MKSAYFYFLLILLLSISCNESKNKNDYQDIEPLSAIVGEGYLGDESCMSCHEEAFADWRGSHHDKAMQLVDEQSVLGDFNDAKASIDGVEYSFHKRENDYLVKIVEIDGSEHEFKVAYVFGITPLQQYIVDFPDGKKQVLRVTWDSRDHKWFHQYSGDEIVITDWLHWTRGAQNWNTMCAECHSTNLKKNYFVEKDSFHTTYSSINVSCESCHGPGAKHVQWADTDQSDTNMHMFLGGDQESQLNMCAPCPCQACKIDQRSYTRNQI